MLLCCLYSLLCTLLEVILGPLLVMLLCCLYSLLCTLLGFLLCLLLFVFNSDSLISPLLQVLDKSLNPFLSGFGSSFHSGCKLLSRFNCLLLSRCGDFLGLFLEFLNRRHFLFGLLLALLVLVASLDRGFLELSNLLGNLLLLLRDSFLPQLNGLCLQFFPVQGTPAAAIPPLG